MAKYHAHDFAGTVKTDMGNVVFDSLKADMDKLRAAGAAIKIVDSGVTSIGTTEGGREMFALKIGRNPANRVLLVGCHHAREWISVEVPFLVGKYLIDNYKEKSAAKTLKEKRINYLVDNAEVWIVPMLNADGHKRTLDPDPATKVVMTGGGAWRTNTHKITFATDTPIERFVETTPYRTQKIGTDTESVFRLTTAAGAKKIVDTIPKGVYEGVDINRNYPTPKGPAGTKIPEWGVETHSDDPKHGGGFVETRDKTGKITSTDWRLSTSRSPLPRADVFCGLSAGSERETKAITSLVGKGSFKCIISYHSFSQLLLFPDDADKDPGTQFLGKGMKALFDDKKVKYAYEPSSGLYPTSGGLDDWIWRAHKVPNYTIELPPTQALASSNGWGFNGLPASQIDPTFSHNLPVALCAINCSISGLSPAALKAAPTGTSSKVVRQCWKVFLGWKQ